MFIILFDNFFGGSDSSSFSSSSSLFEFEFEFFDLEEKKEENQPFSVFLE